jgi:metal-dependent amidase/aminoacylase/carboxypeptidase family protein
LGEKLFGPGNAHAGPCPVYASEDFGNYTNKVPGAFFFLSSGKK